MSGDQHIQQLIVALVQAVEASLAAREAARGAVAEIVKRAAETGCSPPPAGGAPAATLTPEDRAFLQLLSVRFEDG